MSTPFTSSPAGLVSERFDIESRLGSGGFGIVYRAFDRHRNARVALKTLHETNSRTLYRLKREFRVLSDITHPNLVTLYELISERGLWYFTMELVDGVDFLSWAHPPNHPDDPDDPPVDAAAGTIDIAPGLMADTDGLARTEPIETAKVGVSDGSLPPCPADIDRLRAAIGQLIDAVMALHGFGKLHRDIKPLNVLVTPRQRVVLLDFGMVADVGPDNLVQKLERETNPNQIKFAGTPRYMSPEQAMSKPVSEPTDWYTVGVMLYEALTGQAPIEGDSPLELLLRKQSEEPVAPSNLATGIPGDLADLSMALLQRDPSERPTGPEIVDMLQTHGSAGDNPGLTRAAFGSRRNVDQSAFVGRADELEALHRTLMKSVHGSAPAVVNIHGPSGMGKTALVGRFLESIQNNDFQPLVLRGRCYENESVPYKALDSLIDDLSTQLHRFDDAEITRWIDGDEYALTRLFPVLGRPPAVREALEDTKPPSAESTTLRSRAFSALRRLLTGIADKHPLVIFIDDVQWGDEDSAHLLAELMAPPDPPPLFLATTWRSEDAVSSPFLSPYLAAIDTFEKDIECVDLTIGALDTQQARTLAASLLDDNHPDNGAHVDAIAREADGHPFFIDELARHARVYDTGPDSGLTSLNDVILRRVNTLSAPARRLLEVLSVAAQPVDRPIARRVANLGGDEQSVLATLRGEHLLRIKSTRGDERLEPYHGRIGETLLDHLSVDDLQAYHLHLAECFETVGHSDAETTAYHFKQAGSDHKAAHYSRIAADSAAEALAFERATRLYQQALKLGEWPDRRVELLDKLGATYGYLGRGGQAADAYLQAARRSQPSAAANFRIEASEQLLRGGQFDRGLQLIRDTLRDSGFQPATSTWRMAASIMWKRFQLSLRGYEVEACSHDDISEATFSRIEGLWTAAKMLGAIDPIAGAYYHYHTMWEALESGSPSHLALAFCQQAAQEAATRTTFESTVQLLDRADAFVTLCRDPDYVGGYVEFMRGFNHYNHGHFAQGRRLMRRARNMLSRRCDGVIWEVTTIHFFEFFPTYWLGEFDTFAQDMPEMLEHAEARNDRFHSVALRSWMYPVHLRADRPRRARDELDRALNHWTRQGYHMQHFWHLQGSVETALYEGNGLNAWSLIDEHRRRLKRSMLLNNHIIQFIVWHLTSRSAVAALRRTTGVFRRWKLHRAARRAIAKLRDSHAQWVDALADLVEAQLLAQGGDPGGARELLERAERALIADDIALHARAARRRRGQLADNADGDALIESADLWMRQKGIENPAAMTAMVTACPRHPKRAQLPAP